MTTDADFPCGSKRNGLYESTYRSEPLFTGVNLTVFDCPKTELNYYRRRVASIAMHRKFMTDNRGRLSLRQTRCVSARIGRSDYPSVVKLPCDSQSPCVERVWRLECELPIFAPQYRADKAELLIQGVSTDTP